VTTLEIRDLTVRFAGRHQTLTAVDCVDIDLSSGQVLGLVGESGSGKSTLARALVGLVPISSGRVRLDGEDIAAASRRRRREAVRQIQMVFQDPYGSLHPRKTIDRILYEGMAVQRMDDRERRIQRVLYDVGLDKGLRFRHPHELSGGQRQRVAIARALIMEPRILLLDEPTSALDVSVQAEILNLLRELRERRRLTCILVSHNLAVVAHMCERIAVMHSGRIVEELDSADLRAGIAANPYTRQLIRDASGYDRAAVAAPVDLASLQ
jgi:peptide/nickel transport system ATP-binding protein